MTITPDEFRQVGGEVSLWKRPLLLTHSRPDGDALGCLVAARAILRDSGADPISVTFDPVPPKYDLLVEREPIPRLGTDLKPADLDRADGVLIMDTCTYAQLEPVADWLRACRRPKVALDHHVTREDLADTYLVDETASAACGILYRWAQACGRELNSAAVRALFVGIATDTGWFRFSNCDAATLEIAADLVRRGVVPHAVYDRLFQAESVARVRLFGAAIDAVELHDHDRIALIPVTRDMFQKTGAIAADTEDLVNEPLRIRSVQAAVLLAEQDDGITKASFRSKGDIDVAAVAARFGGGGHTKAAGARLRASIDDARQQIIAQLTPIERQHHDRQP